MARLLKLVKFHYSLLMRIIRECSVNVQIVMIANELPPCIPGGPFQDFLKSASLPELEEERIISTF